MLVNRLRPPSDRLDLRVAAGRRETVWQLVFDRLEANPLELHALRQVCRSFDALAGNPLRWLPYTPLAALGLQPPPQVLLNRPPLVEVADVGWVLAERPLQVRPFGSVADAEAHLQQERSVAAGLQPSVLRLPRLPTWLRAPGNERALRRAFERRMQAAMRRANSGEGANLPRLMATLWRGAACAPAFGTREFRLAFGSDLGVELRQAVADHRGDFDLLRAAIDRPEFYVMPSAAALSVQAEPAFFSAYFARSGGTYGGARAPAVTLDVEVFFLAAKTDAAALESVHPRLGKRLDLCVWAVAHAHAAVKVAEVTFAPRPAPFAWGATQLRPDVVVDFSAHQRAVPADSPIFARPGGEQLLRGVHDWAGLRALAGTWRHDDVAAEKAEASCLGWAGVGGVDAAVAESSVPRPATPPTAPPHTEGRGARGEAPAARPTTPEPVTTLDAPPTVRRPVRRPVGPR